MILYIDTAEYNKATFSLAGKKVFKHSYVVDPRKSTDILLKLESFFKTAKVKNPKKEIKKIVIYKGTGSFTGLRVGASIGLALSLAWGSKLTAVKK